MNVSFSIACWKVKYNAYCTSVKYAGMHLSFCNKRPLKFCTSTLCWCSGLGSWVVFPSLFGGNKVPPRSKRKAIVSGLAGLWEPQKVEARRAKCRGGLLSPPKPLEPGEHCNCPSSVLGKPQPRRVLNFDVFEHYCQACRPIIFLPHFFAFSCLCPQELGCPVSFNLFNPWFLHYYR